jgi:iron complex outermembrane recepter protein
MTPVTPTLRHVANRAGFAALLAAVSAPLSGQTAPPPPADDVIQLSVFEVKASTTPSYHTAQTLSGSRTVEAVRDLPLSIQIVNEQMLADFNVTDFRNLGPLLTGAENTENANSERAVTLRGFTSDTQLTNFFIRYIPSDTFNADRVEVIRGANSLIYGEADPGGLLNVVTKRAKFSSESGRASYRLGSDSLHRGEFDANLGSDTLALRVLGLYHSNSSWENWTGDLKRNVFVAGGARLFDKRLTLRGDIEYGERRARTPGSVPTFNFTAADQARIIPASLTAFLAGDSLYARIPAGATLRSLQGYPVPESIITRETKITGPDDITRRTYRNVYAEAQFAATSQWQLLLAANYQQMDIANTVARNTGVIRYTFNTGAFSFNRAWGFRTIDESAQGLRLFSSYEAELGWTKQRLITALDYNRHDTDSINDELYTVATNALVTEVLAITPGSAANDQGANIFFPSGLAGTGRRPLTNNGNALNRVDAYAGLFAASGSYRDGRLRTLAGLRYDKFDNIQRDPVFAGLTRTFGPQRTTTDSRVSPTLGALAHLTKEFSLFGTYSESLKNTNGFRFDENNQVLPPQTGEGLEAGVKFALLGERLNGHLSWFDIEKTNIAERKTITQTDPVTGLPIVRTVDVPGQTGRSRGYEAQLAYDPTPDWTLSLGYAYTDAKISASETAPATVGRRFQGAKKHSLNLLSRYSFATGPLKGFHLGGAWRYRSEPFLENLDGVNVFLDDSNVVDLFAGYHRKLNRRVTWRTQVSVTNALDADSRYTNGGTIRYLDPAAYSWTNTFTF